MVERLATLLSRLSLLEPRIPPKIPGPPKPPGKPLPGLPGWGILPPGDSARVIAALLEAGIPVKIDGLIIASLEELEQLLEKTRGNLVVIVPLDIYLRQLGEIYARLPKPKLPETLLERLRVVLTPYKPHEIEANPAIIEQVEKALEKLGVKPGTIQLTRPAQPTVEKMQPGETTQPAKTTKPPKPPTPQPVIPAIAIALGGKTARGRVIEAARI